jgi:hypothetical protein
MPVVLGAPYSTAVGLQMPPVFGAPYSIAVAAAVPVGSAALKTVSTPPAAPVSMAALAKAPKIILLIRRMGTPRVAVGKPVNQAISG